MAKSFRFTRWVEKTRTYAFYLVAFIYQPVAAPHQAFLPIGSEVPLVKKSIFPPGEAKNSDNFGDFHLTNRSVAFTSYIPGAAGKSLR